MSSKEFTLFSKTTGLNLYKGEEDLIVTPDGTCELSACENVTININGQINRALSVVDSIVTSGAVHTLFSKERTFVGIGTSLYELIAGILVPRKVDCSGNSIKITMYAGEAYCYDGTSFFVVSPSGTVRPWVFTEKRGAATNKTYSGPRAFTKSFTAYGRIFTIHASGLCSFTDPIGPAMFAYGTNVIVDLSKVVDGEGVQGLVVLGTEKETYMYVGENFKQVTKKKVAAFPILPNTLTSGRVNGYDVICFALIDGMYAVTPDGKIDKLTDETLPSEFFKGKVFTGATIVDKNFKLFGTENYSVNIKTKALDKSTYAFDKVSGLYGVQTGVNLLNLKKGVVNSDDVISKITLPKTNFGTSLSKKARKTVVEGSFAATSTWTITDEFGNSSVTTVPANTGMRGFTIPGNSKVKGQFLKYSFTTQGDFDLTGIFTYLILGNRKAF